MRIGVLGTGMVGTTIGTKLLGLGHEVRMGSHTAGNEAATAGSGELGDFASEGTFAGAAGFGEVAFNCTAGAGSLTAVRAASDALRGKVLIDVSNPLDFSGNSPSLFVGITDRLGEQIQRALPAISVVKALNNMNADVMVNPGIVPGDHLVFVCGDDADAKATTVALLATFGWPPGRIVDCGDITGARATEAYLLLWLRMMSWAGKPHFDVAVPRTS